jgi:hypothetical protein
MRRVFLLCAFVLFILSTFQTLLTLWILQGC